jgi:hypothetical protein
VALRDARAQALKIAEALVKLGAPVGEQEEEQGAAAAAEGAGAGVMTALHYAALCHSHSLVRSILGAGGDADALVTDVGGASGE